MANESKFLPSVGSAITREEAREMITKYDKEHRKDKDKDTRSVFYGRELIERILKQDVAGITFFLGSKPNQWAKKDTVQLVLVGTKEDGTLMWPSATAGKDMPEGDGTAGDNGLSCPPSCPTPMP